MKLHFLRRIDPWYFTANKLTLDPEFQFATLPSPFGVHGGALIAASIFSRHALDHQTLIAGKYAFGG